MPTAQTLWICGTIIVAALLLDHSIASAAAAVVRVLAAASDIRHKDVAESNEALRSLDRSIGGELRHRESEREFAKRDRQRSGI